MLALLQFLIASSFLFYILRENLKNFDFINWISNIDLFNDITIFRNNVFSFNLVFPESFEKNKIVYWEIQKPLKAFQILNIHSLVREAACFQI